MASEELQPRSRRALLAAAAGAAGALAANAVMPLTAAAAPTPMQTEQDNPAIATTSITNPTAASTAFVGNASGAGSTALVGNATGSGFGYGAYGTSATGGGVVGWSISPPDASWFLPDYTAYTGVFGYAPANPDSTVWGTGIWGDSPEIGVYGSGGYGVVGYGGTGVEGDANSLPGSIGVRAYAPTPSQIALKVNGKVSFSRSGRLAMSTGTAAKSFTLSGVNAHSKVFAVLATGEPGRWVRSVIPASGKFTVYLNTKLTSSAIVSWFVLD